VVNGATSEFHPGIALVTKSATFNGINYAVFSNFHPIYSIQGDPVGFALVNASGFAIEFLSNGGTVTAFGTTSVDIGISESESAGIGQSLQRYANSSWFVGRSTNYCPTSS
jgi:hypothetical protein